MIYPIGCFKISSHVAQVSYVQTIGGHGSRKTGRDLELVPQKSGSTRKMMIDMIDHQFLNHLGGSPSDNPEGGNLSCSICSPFDSSFLGPCSLI